MQESGALEKKLTNIKRVFLVTALDDLLSNAV